MVTSKSNTGGLVWHKNPMTNDEYVITFFGIYEVCYDVRKGKYHLRRVWHGDWVTLSKDKEDRLLIQEFNTEEEAKKCMLVTYNSVIDSACEEVMTYLYDVG